MYCFACRLPRLDGLILELAREQAPLLAQSMLYSMRAQLRQPLGLNFRLANSCDWLSGANGVFEERGEMTQLTRLCLTLQNTQVSSNAVIGAGRLCKCRFTTSTSHVA
jgi:hypothetical protein